jgi:N,N'-diacetyllegionaminate synthase
MINVSDLFAFETDDASRVCVIAEAGVNHNGSLHRAKEMIAVAAEAGADVVKFQTFSAENVVTKTASKAGYQARETGGGTQLDMLKNLELDRDAHEQLVVECEAHGILFLSTPFEEESANLLKSLGVFAFKLPSGELTNIPFLKHVAKMQLPMIISTGMANMAEVEAAVRAVEAVGNERIVLLHCVSDYPADPVDANLRAIATMHAAFGYPTGYSDHTTGPACAVAAVALGAVVIEKHFTLDRNLPGPDHRASLEPDELKDLVSYIRDLEVAMGDGVKRPKPSELETARVARKSLVAARSIMAGEIIGEADLVARRPGTGISPAQRDLLLGRRATRRIEVESVIDWKDMT